MNQRVGRLPPAPPLSPFGPSPFRSRRFALQSAIAAWFADLALARYLRRRTDKRKTKLVYRKADGTTWAASCPQHIGYAMRSLFAKDRRHSFFMARCRKWRGVLIVSRKVFWRPVSGSDFTLDNSALRDDLRINAFWLAPWPEDVECAKIDADCGDG